MSLSSPLYRSNNPLTANLSLASAPQTLRTFELIDSKVFALALGRWGTLKRAKTQRAAQSDSLAQPIHGDQLPVVLGDPTDSSRYPDMSWLFD